MEKLKKMLMFSVVLAGVMSTPMMAADVEGNESLFGDWETNGYYGSFGGAATRLLGKNASFLDFGWHWTFTNGAEAGVVANTLVSTVEKEKGKSETSVDYYAMGANLGYRVWGFGPVTLMPTAFVGLGHLGYHTAKDENGLKKYKERDFPLFAPGVFADLGVTDHVRLSAGVRMRLTSKVQLQNLNAKDVRGAEALIMLKAGDF